MSSLRREALINWSPLDNLHVTTKFIGEWPKERLGELDRELAALTAREPFEVEIKELGWFPNERSPRVLWAGVHGGDELTKLARQTEEQVLTLGIKKEDRAFAPHLTLARIKHAVPLAALRATVRQMQQAAFGTFVVSRFALFCSEPGSNASIYRNLREYKFESAAPSS